MIGQDDILARAMNPGEYLVNHALFIQPALLRGGLNHSVFATDIVCRHRYMDSVSHSVNDIQIRQRWFHHYHVRAFFDVRGYFFQCFTGIGRIHLVTAAIAKLWSRLGSLAARPAESET